MTRNPESALPGCWVDVFELSRFRGRQRRIFGPSLWPALRSRTRGFGITADSMIAGPAAYIRLYRADDPAATITWVLPNQRVVDVVDWRIQDDVDSLHIKEHPPKPDEAGYREFQLAVERQTTVD